MDGTCAFALAFHQRIPQRAIISGTTFGWSWCTMPPDLLSRESNAKVSPGCTCTSARDGGAGPAVFVEALWRFTGGGFQDFPRMKPVMQIVCKKYEICHADFR